MREDIFYKIQNTPLLNFYLKEHSYEYKNIYRDYNYLKELERKAKEEYKERSIDKLERLENNIRLLNTFIDVMK